MPLVEVNGARLAYEVTGSGPPLVCVRGGLEDAGTHQSPLPWWADDLFAPHYTVIAYDHRAHGSSQPLTDEPFYLETLVEDQRALLDRLGIERAHVMGASLAGLITMQFALTYPGRVNCVVLVSTSPDPLTDEPGEPLRRAFAARQERGADASPAMPAGAGTGSRAVTARMRLREALTDIDLTPLLRRLTMPVYIIHGSEDDLIPAAAAYRLSAAIKGRSTTRVLGAGGHDILDNRRSGAAEYILDWLLRKDAEAANPPAPDGTDDDYDYDPDPIPTAWFEQPQEP